MLTLTLTLTKKTCYTVTLVYLGRRSVGGCGGGGDVGEGGGGDHRARVGGQCLRPPYCR